MPSLKERVQEFWERDPCGTKDATLPTGTREFFEEVERQRFEGDEFMFDVAGFDRWSGRKVLEVGCGLGTDLLQFARGGAAVHAIDLTESAVALTRKRLALYGFSGVLAVSDAERLPFSSDSFDMVYSWGVIHHTPDPGAAAREIVRVCKPGGSVLVMVYHRHSLFALQAWVIFGLLNGKPWRSLTDVIAGHVESPGTQAYTFAEARDLFSGLEHVRARAIVTRYDARLGRRRFLPAWLRGTLPSRWGWFLAVTGTKPGL
jgi:SAM-dependent methyltransferase